MPINQPKYKDPYGPERNNRTTSVDPFIIQQLVKEGRKRGYGGEFPVALAGAETTFGTVGHGSYNPLSYKWKVDQPEIDKQLANSVYNTSLKNSMSALVKDGMPLRDALKTEEYLQERQVKPAVTIQKAFDLLDEKRNFLNTSPKSIAPSSPRRLAWLYQGNGTIGNEIPSGIAYGKPVSKTSPKSDHANIVMQIMGELKKPDNELGKYIRSIK